MDGLSCNEISLQKIKNSNDTFRYDAEYFSKEILRIEEDIKKREHFLLKNNEVVSGPFGSTITSTAYMLKGDVPFIRIENIKGGFHINRENLIYISKKDNNKILNSQLFTDDLILSKVGNSIGFFARVDDEIKTCNISENNIGIKLKNYDLQTKHAILCYLNSKYGQQLVLRRRSGNAQPKLNVSDMCMVPIPILRRDFTERLSDLINESDACIRQSKEKYREAEKYLLTILEFDNNKISTDNISEVKASESFYNSGRLDAEYYQRYYDEYKKMLNTKETVLSLCSVHDKNFLPEDDVAYKYIELANVDDYGFIDNVEINYGYNLPTRARRKVKSGQIIVSSIEGSIQKCAIISDEYNGAICSTGFYVVDSNNINPETLLVLFKSQIIQALMKQRCSGSILMSISKEEFNNLPIPEIRTVDQNYISNKIKMAFELRRKSKMLLEYAKKAIELAIDKDEDLALSYLEKHKHA